MIGPLHRGCCWCGQLATACNTRQGALVELYVHWGHADFRRGDQECSAEGPPLQEYHDRGRRARRVPGHGLVPPCHHCDSGTALAGGR
eukprot:5184942-Amphidinium_carterae.1